MEGKQQDNVHCLYEAQRQKVTAISELQLIPYQLERERSRQRHRAVKRVIKERDRITHRDEERSQCERHVNV